MAAGGTPVSVLCGFLGAGKTTSLKHLIQHETARGRRIAAIANDVAALNIDGALITHACAAAGAEQGASAATVLTLEGGSVCSSLQEDLAEQLADLVGAGAAYDHIFVECSGVTHPAAISFRNVIVASRSSWFDLRSSFSPVIDLRAHCGGTPRARSRGVVADVMSSAMPSEVSDFVFSSAEMLAVMSDVKASCLQQMRSSDSGCFMLFCNLFLLTEY